MHKTKREIVENLGLIDVVIEVLDSRIPISSQNPDIAELTKNKKKIIILNKMDLADPKQNSLWQKYFKQNGQIAILTDCNLGKGINKVIDSIQKIMEPELAKFALKGRTGKKIRVMVLGIPNVGKSSFINRITRSHKLEVANKPGVTKKQQWININEKISLLDTPGVLWPKFQDERTALNLAFVGTIKDNILDQTHVAYKLLEFLLNNYKPNVVDRYNLDCDFIEQADVYDIMKKIGEKRGAMMPGGNIDDEKVAKILLEDFKNAKLGKITIESPSD